MKKGTARGLALVGGLVALGGFAAAAAAATEKKKQPAGGTTPDPTPDALPEGPAPVDRTPPRAVPAPPPDIDEPDAPDPSPMPAPVSREPAPAEPEEEDEPPEVTPTPRAAPKPPVAQPKPAPKPAPAPKVTLPKGAKVIEVTSPKLRESTPAERAQAAKLAPPKPPPPPPEPTAADYAKMHAEASARAKAPTAAVTMPPPVKKTPEGMDRAEARRLAPQVAKNIDAKKYDYDRALVQRFQRAAGLPTDKAYGPETAMALQYYGIRRPPKPLFKGSDGTMRPVPYRWAA